MSKALTVVSLWLLGVALILIMIKPVVDATANSMIETANLIQTPVD